MRNHDEKARDMARSVLPSTRRKGAREDRSLMHHAERARVRRELHRMRAVGDPDDYDGDLGHGSNARRDMAYMVQRRRRADKIGPLIHWAERVVERDPVLVAAPPEDREVYFRRLLPEGLIGDHAITHLWWVIDDRPRWWPRRQRRTPSADDVERVEDIVAGGLHGELNRRVKARLHREIRVLARLPAERLVDEDHPSPGILVPSRTVAEQRRRPLRFLGGAHDVEAFVDEACREVLEVMRELHDECC